MAARLTLNCLRRTQPSASSSLLPRASSCSSSSFSSSVPRPPSFLLLPSRSRLSSSTPSRRRFLSTVSPIDLPSLVQTPASPSSPTTSILASTSSSPPPTPLPISVTAPSPSAIAELKEDGMDIELVPEEFANIQVTDSAWKQLTKIGGREKDPGLRFRVAVESGGCHGYQYKMELTNDLELDDYTFSLPTSTPSPSSDSAFPPTTPIIIDSASLALLKGATIDFATELIGSSFRIAANPQAKGSGCGCGVSWEAI